MLTIRRIHTMEGDPEGRLHYHLEREDGTSRHLVSDPGTALHRELEAARAATV